MMKGRVAWVFWSLAVLAVVTSTATYAWVSINYSAFAKGIDVRLVSDSEYLEISAHPADGYDKEIAFGKDSYIFSNTGVEEICLTAYGYLPSEGGLRITPTLITEENASALGFPGGAWSGEGRIYRAEKSDISAFDSYEDVTPALSAGANVIDYYVIEDTGVFDAVSADASIPYYYRHERTGALDYVSIGTQDAGVSLSGRRYWGYAVSTDEGEAQSDRMLNIVSLDVPTEKYAMKKTAYIRAAKGSKSLTNLKISSIKITGLRNYLTDAIRVMFVASVGGEKHTFFYDHSNPGAFEGRLADSLLGDRAEVVSVEMYIFFDGRNENAYTHNGILSNHSVKVEFSVDEPQ